MDGLKGETLVVRLNIRSIVIIDRLGQRVGKKEGTVRRISIFGYKDCTPECVALCYSVDNIDFAR